MTDPRKDGPTPAIPIEQRLSEFVKTFRIRSLNDAALIVLIDDAAAAIRQLERQKADLNFSLKNAIEWIEHFSAVNDPNRTDLLPRLKAALAKGQP